MANMPKSLPQVYAITPPWRERFHDEFITALEAALRVGNIGMVQLRLGSTFLQLLQSFESAFVNDAILEMLACCHDYTVPCLLNSGNLPLAMLTDTLISAVTSIDKKYDIAGFHLPAKQLLHHQARPIAKQYCLAASCHNREEIERAEDIDVDFIVLSPVLATASHPEVKPLGWQEFKVLVQNTHLPVYALGGMNINHLVTAQQCGAVGVAGIRGFFIRI